MLEIAIGHSDQIEEEGAIKEVLEECEKSLKGQTPKAGILYAGIDFEHQELLDQILERYPDLLLIGCTSDAEMSSKYGVVEDSVLLVLFVSDQIEFSIGLGENVSQNPDAITKSATEQAMQGLQGNPKLCFTAFDTLTTSGLGVLNGLNQALDNEVPVLGGAAADQFKMERSYQFYRGQVLKDAVAVLLLSGDFHFSYGVSSGRATAGSLQRVGRVEGNRIYEIGDMTAVEFYSKYLGSMDKVIGEFPLAVFEGDEGDSFLRAPSSYNDDGSIEFFADIPAGSKVQLTEANRDGILSAVDSAFHMAMENYQGTKPKMVQVTSCAGRKAVLGTRVKEEFTKLNELTQGELPLFGFYGFGELCPLNKGAASKFHNETIVIWLLGE